MTDQLFDVAPKLTEKQQAVLDLTAGDGATDLEVGVELHAKKDCRHCRNSLHGYCEYAASDARKVLGALRKKGLVVRRKTGNWQHTNTAPSSTTSNEHDPATAAWPAGF